MKSSIKPKLEKSLEELENNKWGEPKEDDTNLVSKCLKLRRIPIQDLDEEDLRILISQNIGLKFLVPLALEVLQENPLACGDMDEGSLLKCLIMANNYWEKDEENLCLVLQIAHGLENIDDYFEPYVINKLKELHWN